MSTPWALGDYHAFAEELVWELGPVLVEACGIGVGDRVLDVAAGTGNVAVRAAEAGASVVAADITPEQLEAGRRVAAARGVEIEWVEGDAQALPFEDGEFDVVVSALGVIFAPDHQAVADELVRVCRPEGTIGMLNFTPEGLAGEFFGVFAPYAPPLGPDPPVLWGSEDYVRERFADRVAWRELRRATYTERAESPSAWVRLYEETFGPLIAIRSALPDAAPLDRDLRDFAARANRGAPGGAAEYVFEYLVAVARKR